MERTRIVLIDMPPLLRDVIRAALVPEPDPPPEDVELGLAHPAATKATAASTAAAWKAFLTCYLLFRGACCRPLGSGPNARFTCPLLTRSDRGD